MRHSSWWSVSKLSVSKVSLNAGHPWPKIIRIKYIRTGVLPQKHSNGNKGLDVTSINLLKTYYDANASGCVVSSDTPGRLRVPHHDWTAVLNSVDTSVFRDPFS